MKLKLAILEKDWNYLHRIVATFEARYSEKIELYSFTDQKKALNTLTQNKIDIFLVSDVFNIAISDIPKKTSLAYLVETSGVNSKNGCPAISKYQKADLMYKQILGIYAERGEVLSGGTDSNVGGQAAHVVVFSSPCGGVGTSSLAAAYSLRLARRGKKALYLNLEKINTTDSIFAADGKGCISDIIYALKKRTNLPIKLESCARQDSRGVFYFAQAKSPLDMAELSDKETEYLIDELKLCGAYDYVVIDLDFRLDQSFFDTLKKMKRIVMATDGSDIANRKVVQAINSINTIDMDSDTPLSEKIGLIYNKYSNKTGKAVEMMELARIGGAPRFEHANCGQVIDELSKLAMFDDV